MADPNLEVREGGGSNLLALLAFSPFSFLLFFLPKIKGGGLGPLGPSPRSATDYHLRC